MNNRNRYKNILDEKIVRQKNQVQVDSETNTIFLYDEIGFFGITASDFTSALNQTDPGKRLTVAINSPGGDIFDGIAIFNLLVGRGNVDIRIDGFAASIASVIAMAGETIAIAENATMMIHNPWTVVMGDATDLRHEAEVLDKLKTTLISSYQRHSSLGSSTLSSMMNDETWLLAQEAKENGLVTSIINEVQEAPAAQNFDLTIYRNCPDRFRAEENQNQTSGGAAQDELRRYHFQLRHRTNVARSLTNETD